MPTWILDIFIKEWAVIKQAPVTFIALSVLAFGLAFLLARWLYQDGLTRKNDLIADLRQKLLHSATGPTQSKSGEEDSSLSPVNREAQLQIDNLNRELATTCEQRDSLRSQVDELTQFKILTEVDTKPRQSDTGHQLQSSVSINYEALDKSLPLDKFLLNADLRVRFDNRNALAGRIQTVTVFLRREAKGETHQTEVAFSAIEETTRAEQGFVDLAIPHGLTPYFRLDCQIELEKSWAKILDDHCFLRVITEAKQQPPYCIDLNVEWQTAKVFDCVAGLSQRRSGACA
jgi:hypothetical protein